MKGCFFSFVKNNLDVSKESLTFAHGASHLSLLTSLKSDTESIVNHLSRIGIGEVFDLSEDCTPSDSVYVVAPYSSDFFEKNPHLELMSCIKRDIERAAEFDSYFQLLFVKGNKVVSHATINRDIVSYFGLDSCNIYNSNQKFHIKTKLYLDEHRIVHQK